MIMMHFEPPSLVLKSIDYLASLISVIIKFIIISGLRGHSQFFNTLKEHDKYSASLPSSKKTKSKSALSNNTENSELPPRQLK